MKLENNSSDNNYGAWPRILNIRAGNSSFSTPTNMVTSQILNAKADLKLEVPIPGNIALYTNLALNVDHLSKYLNSNEYVNTKIRDMRMHRRRVNNFPIRIMYIYPETPDFSIFKGHPDIQHQFLELLKNVSNGSEYEVLAIPFLSNDIREQLNLLQIAAHSVEYGDLKEIVPVLDVSLPPPKITSLLEEILDKYHDTGLIKAIAIQNSFDVQYSASRAYIAQKLYDKELLTLVFRVEKTYKGFSGINAQSLRFGDSFANRVVNPPNNKNSDQNKYDPSFLDNTSLKFKKILTGASNDRDYIKIRNELNQFLGEDFNNYAERILQNYIENPIGRREIQNVGELSKVHYSISLEKEFARLKTRMLNGSYSEYVEDREEILKVSSLAKY